MTTLGKRKRRQASDRPNSGIPSSEDQKDYQEALRNHFEATFEPVESDHTSSVEPSFQEEGFSSETDLESDWNGLSEDDAPVQVIDHTNSSVTRDEENDLKSMRKRFMSSKMPRKETELNITGKKSNLEDSESKTASSLTAEDIALQRLLSESHLLSGSTTSTLLPTLKARQQAQDLRLQSLGAKKPLAALGAGNVPMAIRKGMEKKKSLKEKTRRQEAREIGVILEKEVKTTNNSGRRKRTQGVGAPSVGKWRGGTLVLGKKDVAEIEGQRLSNGSGKKSKKSKKSSKRR